MKSKPVDRLIAKNLRSYIRHSADKTYVLITNEFKSYKGLDKEYVRGNVYTNTAEGYFSLLKRGVNGTYHHVSKKHLQRYLNEFDFMYNMRMMNDSYIASMVIEGIEGKSLFYHDSYYSH